MTAAAKSIPQVVKGYSRQWLKCRECGQVTYYDFVPYSFSNPIATLPCHHGVSLKDLGADRISEKQALNLLRRRHVI